MTLNETLKYMETQIPLKEATVNGVNNVLNSQGLSNEIKISQGQGQNIVINGKEYSKPVGDKALNIILMQTHPDKTQGLDKNKILQNVINSLSGIDSGSISQSIQQNMSLPAQSNGNQINVNAQNSTDVATTNNQQPNPPAPVENQQSTELALVQQANTEIANTSNQISNTPIPNFDKFNEMSNLLSNDLDKILAATKTLANSLNNNPTIQQNEQLQQNIQNLNNTINDDEKKSAGFKNFLKGLGGFLGKAANFAAGVAGTFLGSMAGGMGAAK